jgi:hypothetical protein
MNGAVAMEQLLQLDGMPLCPCGASPASGAAPRGPQPAPRDQQQHLQAAEDVLLISNINLPPLHLPACLPSFDTLVFSGRFTPDQERLLLQALPALTSSRHIRHLDLSDYTHSSYSEPRLSRQLLSRCRWATAGSCALPQPSTHPTSPPPPSFLAIGAGASIRPAAHPQPAPRPRDGPVST